jgi:hypothetical protein
MFLKLKNLFYIDDFNKLDLRIKYGSVVNNVFKGLKYHNVDVGSCVTLLYSPIPERFRKDFFIYTIEANSSISPHIDSNVKAVINFYLKPSNCATNFYKIKAASETYKLAGQTTGSMFKKSSLNFIDGFVAKENEAWLLDVTHPHSIDPLSSDPVDRFAITVQTLKYSFDQVKDMLLETNNI